MKINLLEWDSEFWNMKIGSVFCESNNLPTFENLNEFDCVYIYTEEECDKVISLGAQSYGSNITLRKKICSSLSYAINSSIDVVKQSDDNLVNLGLQSGIYSRFYLDKKLSHKFPQMYKIWINNYINTENKRTFVYKKDEKGVGVINCKIDKNIGKIGLFAVDKSYRFMGIGSALLNEIELYYLSKNVTLCEVVTQGDNIPAINIYKKHGYSIISENYIYHWYKKTKEESYVK